ncbi:bacterial alpha-L-rhamnosidase domain protein [Aspergillus steynii IBT 23096]|uniref:alpha-L-rhamnosidase n=1 Tax=Aspergillus steynii IBT 23096 TaxID=1392250 RepID=A0A2I2G0X9_9EURO|nr:bacterial alpha-L-rhamnosidase domain protein [Aspergillus steynii IBT 23096]PLB46496.1 bacterial alpha-L-rhamnosidase domain protein [Aspergillus steynii IBT 23096]
MPTITNLRFEHYHAPNTLGVQETRPRLSWRFQNAPASFQQAGYEVELSQQIFSSNSTSTSTFRVNSPSARLVPWPDPQPLQSRQRISARVRAWDATGESTAWSDPASLEAGLLSRSEWQCDRIAAPWGPGTLAADPEQLYRKEFSASAPVAQARLYITAQGVYEADINGHRVGDHFLAPGWTTYDSRLQYQTYDVTEFLSTGTNCIGVRVAEGWFSGRIGFEGGHRNIWGPHTALLAQLEIVYADGDVERVVTDGSWTVTKGPIQKGEIYDGEKYDARLEIEKWSSVGCVDGKWEAVLRMDPLPEVVELTAGYGEPVRRIEVLSPVKKLVTPSGKLVLDFGQNLVGYVRLRNIRGPRGHRITLSHAEVLEKEELCTRPLRICQAVDEYTLRGDPTGEEYEPRFTFHGFRYAQVDGWTSDIDLEASAEAVVCHTDMKPSGSFSCSDPLLNKLYQNIEWGMRGNFLSVPTDCPQRDERLGWSGDLALFAPTATLIYDCFGMLRNWLIDVEHDQKVLDGVPAMVTPNATLPDPIWCRRQPCAIWHDVTILAPWALYQETGDKNILRQQYDSMTTWMETLPRNKTGATHLWDTSIFQLGDWLDPAAPPSAPWKGLTDAKMVSNAFLIHSLDLISLISSILDHPTAAKDYSNDATLAREQFQSEYVTPNGRIASDSQAAYTLAITFDLLTPAQRIRAGSRLVELVRKNNFHIGTGFAGTPFLCEALLRTGHVQVAYAMLTEKTCPSWLYPVTMGATTVWERWDSMLPDGSINPGEMTSFNHYAFGAIARFLYERVAGLERVEAGWKRCRVRPAIGGDIRSARAQHETPFGVVSCACETRKGDGVEDRVEIEVCVPYGVVCEVVIPEGEGERTEVVGAGEWQFHGVFRRDYEWPVKPLPPKS